MEGILLNVERKDQMKQGLFLKSGLLKALARTGLSCLLTLYNAFTRLERFADVDLEELSRDFKTTMKS